MFHARKLLSSLCFSIIAALSFVSAYIVVDGDTLWDLSDNFLQDPFQWPEIWEKNPHIENPHLIYPGDSLNISGKDSPKKFDKDDLDGFGLPREADPADTSLPEGFRRSWGESRRGDVFLNRIGMLSQGDTSIKLSQGNADSVIWMDVEKPKKEFLLSTEIQRNAPRAVMPVSRAKVFADEVRITPNDLKLSSNSILPGEEFILEAGNSTGILVGDTIVIFSLHSFFTSSESEKEEDRRVLVTKAGTAKVVAVGTSKSRATLLKAYTLIRPDNVRARIRNVRTPVVKIGSYRKVPKVDLNKMPSVLYQEKAGNIATSSSYSVINAGFDKGFNTGDAVAFWEEKSSIEGAAPRMLAEGIVVNSQKNTATLMVRSMFYPNRTVREKDKVSITFIAQKP